MNSKLIKKDKQIADLIKKELGRQREGLNLIASENYPSVAVLEALANVLTSKYSEGYPGQRYYSGQQFVDQIEKIAISRAKKLFKAAYANVQPHSGSQANEAVYEAILNPGDKVLAMKLDCGGHLSHGSKINFSGKRYSFYHYGVNLKSHLIDYGEIEQLALKVKPKMIFCGASSYPGQIDFKKLAQIAKKVKAVLVADVAHIAGLIVGGQHAQPFPHVDIVTTTTHKTLRGPRGGLILAKRKYAKDLDKAVFPGIQGGPMENIIAAKAVCFKEAQTSQFKKYQKQIVKNAQALAEALKEKGLSLITNGTKNHLILINLTKKDISGQKAQDLLESFKIYVNKNVIPFDPRKPVDPSGIRLGTAALTSRGFDQKEFKAIGYLIALILKGKLKTSHKKRIQIIIEKLTQKHPLY